MLLRCMDSDPSSTAYQLGELEQVIESRCAFISSFVKY